MNVRRKFLVVLATALCTGAFVAPPASAAPVGGASISASSSTKVPGMAVSGNIQIIALGKTEGGGWVTYSGLGTVTLDGTQHSHAGVTTMLTTVDIEGGTWAFGASVNGGGQKTCTSEYYHPSRSHGSSVTMNGMASSDYVGPGDVSWANVTGWTNAICKAYYRF